MPAFGELAMTITSTVIARSEATKQSQNGIATPPFGRLAMTKADAKTRLPRLPFRKPRNDKGFEIATPAFGELAMTITPRCHCEERSDEAISFL